MKKLIYPTLILLVIATFQANAQDKTYPVKSFEKVIVSPHVEVIFVEGTEESVKIENAKVSDDKINIEVEGKTLRVYLDGAKFVTKSKKVDNGNYNGKKSIYNGTMATATITYKSIKNLSIRGEEVIKCESPMNQKELKLAIYGESKVYFKSLTAEELTVSIYGESYLEMAAGSVDRQVYRAYGESEVNAIEMDNTTTKITAYGESNFRVKVSEKLKVTCYGETTINYKGEASIDKGLIVGEAEIRKIG